MEVIGQVSPWWWIAAAIALAAADMVIAPAVLVWAALAAFVVAVLLWAAPELSIPAQLGLFAALSIAFIFGGRAVAGLVRTGGDASGKLNRRAEGLVGREAVVLSFDFHEGRVEIDGIPWNARLEGEKTPEIGSRVEVIAADGATVWVRRIRTQPAAGRDT
jgi:membrane protein implicated in regulation of membrane protease activity